MLPPLQRIVTPAAIVNFAAARPPRRRPPV